MHGFRIGNTQCTRDIAQGCNRAVAAVANGIAINFQHGRIVAVANGHTIAVDAADGAVAAVADGYAIAVDSPDGRIAGIAKRTAIAVHFTLSKSDKCCKHQRD